MTDLGYARRKVMAEFAGALTATAIVLGGLGLVAFVIVHFVVKYW